MVNSTVNPEEQNGFCCSDSVHESTESFGTDSHKAQADSMTNSTASPEEQNAFHLPEFKKAAPPNLKWGMLSGHEFKKTI